MKRPALVIIAIVLWVHPVPYTDISGRMLPRRYHFWKVAVKGQEIGRKYYSVDWLHERGRSVRTVRVNNQNSFPYILN